MYKSRRRGTLPILFMKNILRWLKSGSFLFSLVAYGSLSVACDANYKEQKKERGSDDISAISNEVSSSQPTGLQEHPTATANGNQQKPKYPSHKGRYINRVYGYSVQVPEGYTGYSSPPPAPDHGLIIIPSGEGILPDAAATYISTDGSYNAAFHTSADEIVDERIGWRKEKAKDLTIIKRDSIQLGKLPAEYISMRFKDDHGRVFIEDLTVALREIEGEVGIFYTIGLSTTEDRYNQDKTIYDQVLESWKAIRTSE